MHHIRYRQAFTMIELIIVIVILGVLAGIAIVGYGAIVDRANDRAAYQAAASFDRSLRSMAAFDQTTPRTEALVDAVIASVAVETPDSLSAAKDTVAGGFVTDVELTDGQGRMACLVLSDAPHQPGAVTVGACA